MRSVAPMIDCTNQHAYFIMFDTGTELAETDTQGMNKTCIFVVFL